MGSSMKDRQNGIIESFQSLFGKEELLAKVIECFPYPIQVYALDGTSVLVNQAMLDEYHAVSFDMVVGKYNIFNRLFSGCQSAFGRNCGAVRHTGFRCGGRISGYYGFPYSG